MSSQEALGYLRHPTLAGGRVLFVAEDDLWTVSADGGVARRLTTALSDVTLPWLDPTGQRVAFVAREEGVPEVHVMDAEGGVPRQLTHLGASTACSGWAPDGRVAVVSDARAAFGGVREVYLVSPQGGPPERMPWGPANRVAFGAGGGVVLGRNVGDPARWKRYRGGTAGEFWVDAGGQGDFVRWSGPAGNLSSPMWIGERVYFLSDHEGVGNLYSCLPGGEDPRRHTDHGDYYARNAQTDGRHVVYHCGGDLWLHDVETDRTRPLTVELRSQRTQRQRRFVSASQYLQDTELHPQGHSLLVTARGHAYAFGNWEGPVLPVGEEHGVRYRLGRWLPDGRHAVLVADTGGEEALEVHSLEGARDGSALPGAPLRRLDGLDLGRVIDLAVAPVGERVAVANHRLELWVVDLSSGEGTCLETNRFGRFEGLAWSPDGRWLCWSAPESRKTTALRLWRAPAPVAPAKTPEAVATPEVAVGGDAPAAEAAPVEGARPAEEAPAQDGPPAEREPAGNPDDDGPLGPVTITRPVLHDVQPSFDPEGKYLYFLSYRTFDPVYDNLQFDLGFPRGVRPYLLTLQADTPSPLLPAPRPLGEPEEKHGEAEGEEGSKPKPEGKPDGRTEERRERKGAPVVRIDLEGIADRLLALPVPDGRYSMVAGMRGKVLFVSWPVQGTLHEDQRGEPERGTLEAFDLKELKADVLVRGIQAVSLSMDARTLLYRSGDRVRVLPAGKKPDDGANGEPGRRSGWVQLSRVQVPVDPGREWAQMLREAWRLQRDNFWNATMSDVDWPAVWERYSRLLPRIGTRGELSDLMWEMQGELGTSHAYEGGGDYRPSPHYGQGFLGADLDWDEGAGGYRVSRLIRGDSWQEGRDSPLRAPGVRVAEGDVILAVDGRRVSAEVPVEALLVGRGRKEVSLLVRGPAVAGAEAKPRSVVVRALESERQARYRAWVEDNRARVHAASQGRLGYVHIPDMGPRGYAEFHRGWLSEAQHEGLIVDIRHNGGGHVSQLILEKLARRPIGWDVPRWGVPEPYPAEAVAGPVVALTNELAGSDGDIFSHAFKLLKIGPLVGKRTWGGVIGIWVRHPLVDGTFTSQPEFAYWFSDVGWSVENYGTDPDIPVENRPQDHVAGVDAQLRRSIDEALAWLAERPPLVPDFGHRPSRALPVLPPRG